MFQPSQNDVRRFFCTTQARLLAGAPLEPMQAVAASWIGEHPEYQGDPAGLMPRSPRLAFDEACQLV